MSTPPLVDAFYSRVWEARDMEVARTILSDDFAFRGSLGPTLHGRAAFVDYVTAVHGALADYRCEVLDCVSEKDQAFAQMRFSGRHTGSFRGFAPTGKAVSWMGAALFRFAHHRIASLWVLGDLDELDRVLRENAGGA